ncbi:hypothetical protein Q8F55_005212 [Vanrija albida]|uniref:Fungal lipase-type domain-containing protein n=1 Tax=Vanrija albida TaxID=181172 RepID=A0ABR3Q107_9TREE
MKLLAIAALLPTLALAAPAPVTLAERSSVGLSPDVVNTWAPLAQYATAAYCGGAVWSWSCGGPCDAVAQPAVLAQGGDAKATPYFYVANNGSHIIVSISGTNTRSIQSLADDLEFNFTTPSGSYFPGADGVQVHHGFYNTFTRVAGTVGPVVQNAVNAGATQVIVTGHSLGSAVGHLTATYLQNLLGTSATVYARLFASPRVGNQAWADYVDATLGDRAQHMINYNDLVPTLPPRSFGFRQSSNEVWIANAAGTSYVACPGQESTSCQDSMNLTADIESFVEYLDFGAHSGPYAGVKVTSAACA